MARQIIILERVDEPSDNSFNVAFWLTVPATRVSAYANGGTSRFKQATAPELAAIAAGQVVEIVEKMTFIAGTGVAAIQAALIAHFNILQARITANNPTIHYGTSWDGATWTLVGTA